MCLGSRPSLSLLPAKDSGPVVVIAISGLFRPAARRPSPELSRGLSGQALSSDSRMPLLAFTIAVYAAVHSAKGPRGVWAALPCKTARSYCQNSHKTGPPVSNLGTAYWPVKAASRKVPNTHMIETKQTLNASMRPTGRIVILLQACTLFFRCCCVPFCWGGNSWRLALILFAVGKSHPFIAVGGL